MAPAADLSALLKLTRELAEITDAARTYAVNRDFGKLAQAIDRRDQLIKELRSKGDFSELPSEPRSEVTRALERTQQMDMAIRSVIEREMASDNAAITDAVARAKVLSAYEKIVPRSPKFDTQK